LLEREQSHVPSRQIVNSFAARQQPPRALDAHGRYAQLSCDGNESVYLAGKIVDENDRVVRSNITTTTERQQFGTLLPANLRVELVSQQCGGHELGGVLEGLWRQLCAPAIRKSWVDPFVTEQLRVGRCETALSSRKEAIARR